MTSAGLLLRRSAHKIVRCLSYSLRSFIFWDFKSCCEWFDLTVSELKNYKHFFIKLNITSKRLICVIDSYSSEFMGKEIRICSFNCLCLWEINIMIIEIVRWITLNTKQIGPYTRKQTPLLWKKLNTTDILNFTVNGFSLLYHVLDLK